MKELIHACKKIIPIFFSYVFVGFALGVVSIEAGLPLYFVVLTVLFLYAGSFQFVLISMLTSNTGLFVIGITAAFVNARHIFYGIGLYERYKRQGILYPYMIGTLTDEVYSIYFSKDKTPENIDEKKVDFLINFLCHLLAIVSEILGAVSAQMLPFDMTGIDFSSASLFIAVAVAQIEGMMDKKTAVYTLIATIALYIGLGKDNFIMPAMCVSFLIIYLSDRRKKELI